MKKLRKYLAYLFYVSLAMVLTTTVVIAANAYRNLGRCYRMDGARMVHLECYCQHPIDAVRKKKDGHLHCNECGHNILPARIANIVSHTVSTTRKESAR